MGFIAAGCGGTKDLRGRKVQLDKSFSWSSNPELMSSVCQWSGLAFGSFSCRQSIFFYFKDFGNLLEPLNPHDYIPLNALLCCLGIGRSLASA